MEHALDVSRVTVPAGRRRDPRRPTWRRASRWTRRGRTRCRGWARVLIERIEGDVFGVMGLPLRLALDLLARFGRPYRFTR